MNRDQAVAFLKANYPETLVKEYVDEAELQYGTGNEYWARLGNEEALRCDMDLYVEATPLQTLEQPQ